MAYQISDNDPIWQLTPTELNVAYLSLTKSKKEIADQLLIAENTIGQHLTRIFEKLGLSDFPDDEKRALLKSTFGESLERLVSEINGDYQGEYRRRRREALGRRMGGIDAKEPEDTSPVGPTMQEPPPPPRPGSGRIQPIPNAVPRIVWILGGLLILFALCGLLGLNILRSLLNPTFNVAPQTPSNTAQATRQATSTNTSAIPTQTAPETAGPTLTSTFTAGPPTETPTLEITPPPPAVDLPVHEDFSKQYRKEWRVIGNPFITENIQFGDERFSGVLTTEVGDTAALWIGNTAWTDYVVSLRVNMPLRDNHLRVGIRVQDINNMIALDCEPGAYLCSWIIIENGAEEKLPTETQVYLDPFTITAQGDNFTVSGSHLGQHYGDMSLILPPKYKGKFTGGGVFLQITSALEIDFIQIDPIP